MFACRKRASGPDGAGALSPALVAGGRQPPEATGCQTPRGAGSAGVSFRS